MRDVFWRIHPFERWPSTLSPGRHFVQSDEWRHVNSVLSFSRLQLQTSPTAFARSSGRVHQATRPASWPNSLGAIYGKRFVTRRHCGGSVMPELTAKSIRRKGRDPIFGLNVLRTESKAD